jgi:hypothetical protein
MSIKENKTQTQCRGFCYKLILNLSILSVINDDICVFDIFCLDKDNLNYNIYPLVVIKLHKNTTNTFSNTV